MKNIERFIKPLVFPRRRNFVREALETLAQSSKRFVLVRRIIEFAENGSR